MKRQLALSVLIFLVACNFNPEAKIPIGAAKTFTQKLAKQKLEARAAGNDCLILLIRASIPLDGSTVEAIQYGTGEYGAYDGGAQQFAEDQRFRAVAYKDSNGGLWTYGSITRSEAQAMALCR